MPDYTRWIYLYIFARHGFSKRWSYQGKRNLIYIYVNDIIISNLGVNLEKEKWLNVIYIEK